ncbi:MAG: hypothetical protein LBK94_07580 [Prevotellaceae bacterium]|jgi:IS30 family transposase|nr:hypothetical protein [Prevotellaceae bacterium]
MNKKKQLTQEYKIHNIPDAASWMYSLWENGLNEYTNGLARHDNIKIFQTKINKRPRKLLNFDTPVDRFYKEVAFIN